MSRIGRFLLTGTLVVVSAACSSGGATPTPAAPNLSPGVSAQAASSATAVPSCACTFPAASAAGTTSPAGTAAPTAAATPAPTPIKSGTVVAWGDDSAGQTDVPAGLTGVVAVAAGDEFSLALKSDGTVVGWGATDADVGETKIPAAAIISRSASKWLISDERKTESGTISAGKTVLVINPACSTSDDDDLCTVSLNSSQGSCPAKRNSG